MKRELVTGLLTLSLLASMLPANAQAAEGMFGASAAGQVQTMTEGAGEDGVQTENAADIDGTQYATLAEAVAQAEEGATIRLLRDVELDASGLVNGQGALTLSKDLTLDGSGHTHPGEGGHIFCLRRQWHRPQPPQSSGWRRGDAAGCDL